MDNEAFEEVAVRSSIHPGMSFGAKSASRDAEGLSDNLRQIKQAIQDLGIQVSKQDERQRELK